MTRDYPKPNSIPVDSVAARTMGKGVHFTPSVDPESVRFESALPCKPYPLRGLGPIVRAGAAVTKARQYRDFTGKVYGDIVIVGFLGGRRGKEMWLGKCVCGYYVKRRDKTLRKKSKGAFDYCSDCMARDRVRAEYSYRTTGKTVLLKSDPRFKNQEENEQRAKRRRERLRTAQ